MKAALNVALGLTFCAFLLADGARAQSEAQPQPLPPPESVTPPPGILLTPPRPPPEPQHSCPDTGQKLELVV